MVSADGTNVPLSKSFITMSLTRILMVRPRSEFFGRKHCTQNPSKKSNTSTSHSMAEYQPESYSLNLERILQFRLSSSPCCDCCDRRSRCRVLRQRSTNNPASGCCGCESVFRSHRSCVNAVFGTSRARWVSASVLGLCDSTILSDLSACHVCNPGCDLISHPTEPHGSRAPVFDEAQRRVDHLESNLDS